MVGKTAHKVSLRLRRRINQPTTVSWCKCFQALAVVETGANLAKSGAVALRLQRAPNAAALRNAAALDLVDASASSSSVSSVALELEAEHSMAVLRRLFAAGACVEQMLTNVAYLTVSVRCAVIGTVGELDPKVFKSFNGEATIKCYHKVSPHTESYVA